MPGMSNPLVQTTDLTARQWAFDAAVAVAAFAFSCAQLLLTSTSVIVHDEMFRSIIGYVSMAPSPAAFCALALLAAPLALRRVSPWGVYAFVLVVYLCVQDAFRGYSVSMAAPMVAAFTVASERSRVETVVCAVISALAFLTAAVPVANEGLASFFRIQNVTYMACAILAGYAVRAYRDYVKETESRALEAERTREEEAARRVEEERVRIAREIHDITAHSLSAVSIQAAAAERLLDRNPEAAREAIANVRSVSKSALEEIRAMIGVLRDGESAETSPTQGTDRMADLADYLEEAGVSVTMDLESYDRGKVPSYVDIALFGIAREAVTNIVRHANAASASIRLESTSSRAVLCVEDDGVGISADRGGGHGIEGMEERVGLLRGSFEAAPRPGGGTSVRATIPLSEKEA